MEIYVKAFLANWQPALWGGIIVVSAVIVIMGMLKILFNKINNKLLRKFLLSFTSVVLALPATAIYFVGAEIDFKYFWVGYALSAIATIVVYWFYENTCLRDLIHKIGSVTIWRFIQYIANRITGNGNIEEDLEALKSTTKSLQDDVKSTVNEKVAPYSDTVSQISANRIPIATTKVVERKNTSLQKEASELKNL